VETALIVERNLPRMPDGSRQEAAVMAALLHDVLDDTATDLAELQDEWVCRGQALRRLGRSRCRQELPAAGCLAGAAGRFLLPAAGGLCLYHAFVAAAKQRWAHMLMITARRCWPGLALRWPAWWPW
jgi:hypothetical protein